MTAKHRTRLLDKSLLYVLSYDVEVNMDREAIGFVAGGVRVNIAARENLSRAYYAPRERTVAGLGMNAINGTVVGGGDQLYWREDDIEFSDVRLSIITDDGETIHGSYPVVTYLGPGGFRHIVSGKGKIGTEDAPVEIPVITSPRFETSSPTYAWLNELQCVGFGRVTIVRSEFRRITYDVYALS